MSYRKMESDKVKLLTAFVLKKTIDDMKKVGLL